MSDELQVPPSAPPEAKKPMGYRILKGVGWFLLILGGLILLAALLLLGTCLIMLANNQ